MGEEEGGTEKKKAKSDVSNKRSLLWKLQEEHISVKIMA